METDGSIWLTHPHPALADSIQAVENNQRILKGSLDVSMRPFGKVLFFCFAIDITNIIEYHFSCQIFTVSFSCIRPE